MMLYYIKWYSLFHKIYDLDPFDWEFSSLLLNANVLNALNVYKI